MYTRVHVHIYECTHLDNLEQILTISEVPSKSEQNMISNNQIKRLAHHFMLFLQAHLKNAMRNYVVPLSQQTLHFLN